jgi:hypothetical protein
MTSVSSLLRLSSLAALLCVAMVVSACQVGPFGSDPNQDVKELVDALWSGNKAVCDRMTDGFEAQFYGSVGDCENEIKSHAATNQDISLDSDKKKATVTQDVGTLKVTLTAVDVDGTWKLESAKDDSATTATTPTAPPATTTPTTPSAPSTGSSAEVEAEGATQAFVDAVREKDQTVLCGILSEKLARELTESKSSNPIADCLDAKVNFRKLKRLLASDPTTTTVTGTRAESKLGNGVTVKLRKVDGRWVVDDLHSGGALLRAGG